MPWMYRNPVKKRAQVSWDVAQWSSYYILLLLLLLLDTIVSLTPYGVLRCFSSYQEKR